LTRQRVVIGSGPSHARLALVGEAPGRTEDEGGQPFIGRSGSLLFDLVASELSLTREECFVTNVVKCRPPNNRPPRRAEIAACRPWLDEQLAELGDAVIVTLGNTATRALLGITEGISSVRGRPTALGRAVVVATFHPAAALRGGPSVVAMMREDLAVVRAELASRR
jgi:DNA polymerase